MRVRGTDIGAGAPTAVRLLVALGLALVLAGCGGSETTPSGPKSVAPTPISRLNAGALQLARGVFCGLVPAGAVRDALGGDRPVDQRSWRNGDPAQVETGVTDVVHEYGCSWTSADHAASAWLFARSLSPAQAGTVIDKTSRRRGCRSTPGPGFGSPSQRQACTLPDGSHRVRLAGLFGDDWLTCQVSGPAGESRVSVRTRAGAWCVQIANATNTAR